MAFAKLPKPALAKLHAASAKFGIVVGYEIYQLSKLLPEKGPLEMVQ